MNQFYLKNKLNFILAMLVLIVLISCNPSNTKKSNKNFVAIINESDTIRQESLDSIASDQILELRKKALSIFLREKLLMKESQKYNIDIQSYIEKMVNKKTELPSELEIKKFIINSPNFDYQSASYSLTNIKRTERTLELLDSLKQVYDVKVFLQPSNFKRIEIGDIHSINIASDKGDIEVYIISNFECPSCNRIKAELKSLYEKFYEHVSFKYIYYSSYIDSSGLACEAAANQGKFIEMYEALIENYDNLHKDSICYTLANKIGLDMNKFANDMNNPSTLKKLMINKEAITKLGVYSTPSFVVNKLLLDDKYAINYLEKVIINELEKINKL